jgi:pimeloyl-ACP methyl ester carboxylesterase
VLELSNGSTGVKMVGIPETIILANLAGRGYRLAGWSRDSGEELVLFVHGLACSKENFRPAWSRQELSGCSLLAVDLLGFGRSPRPADFSYRLEDQARILASVIDGRALKNVHLVAHSMGGTIALLMPQQVLARLKTCILIEPRMSRRSSNVAKEISGLDWQQFQTDFLPRFKQRCINNQRFGFDVERVDPAGFYKSALSMTQWLAGDSILNRFMNAPCPRVFVYGRDNPHLAELETVPADLQYGIEGAGHFVMHDNPDRFYRYLGSCLHPRG